MSPAVWLRATSARDRRATLILKIHQSPGGEVAESDLSSLYPQSKTGKRALQQDLRGLSGRGQIQCQYGTGATIWTLTGLGQESAFRLAREQSRGVA